MNISVREVQPDDLEECFDLAACRPYFRHWHGSPKQKRQQIEYCRGLLSRAAVQSGVTAAVSNPSGERILTFGLSAFVRSEWLRNYLRKPFPFAGAWIIERLATGKDDIILTDEEVRKYNSSGGLHSLTLYTGWCLNRLLPNDMFTVKQYAAAAFISANQGYQMEQFVTEIYPGLEADFYLASGTWRERARLTECDFLPSQKAVSGYESILIGLSREDVQKPGQDISVLTQLFVRHKIRFRFTLPQQQLLKFAGIYVSDHELANALGLSLDALGRRLDRIYKRVERLQDPSDPVFPRDAAPFAKRRLLLDRLRKNMHELRPHNFSNSGS